MEQSRNPGNTPAPFDQTPILFHDGCGLCLDIAQTLRGIVAGLRIIDLGKHPELQPDAVARGVERLPSLVVGARVLPIAPHSDVAHIGAN